MIEHLSYSSIKAYLDCGRNWQMKYIDGRQTYGSPQLAFGSAFHNTVEEYLTNGGELTAIWPEKWRKESEEPRNTIIWGIDSPTKYLNDGLRILSNSDVQAMIQQIQIGRDEKGVLIERQVELRVPNVPVPIIGYIDIQTADGVPGDFKTSSRSWSMDQAQSETQSLFYLAALNQAGRTVPGWRFRHYVVVKTKEPKAQVFEHAHKPGEVMWLFRMIQAVWKGIEAGVFPENPGSWKCSPDWCDFWRDCRGKYV